MPTRNTGINAGFTGITNSLGVSPVNPKRQVPGPQYGAIIASLTEGAAGIAQQLARGKAIDYQNSVAEETNLATKYLVDGVKNPTFKTQEAHDFFYKNAAVEPATNFNPETLQINDGETAGDAYARWLSDNSAGMPDTYTLALKQMTQHRFAEHMASKVSTEQKLMMESAERDVMQYGIIGTRTRGPANTPSAVAIERSREDFLKQMDAYYKLAESQGQSREDVDKRVYGTLINEAVASGKVEWVDWLTKQYPNERERAMRAVTNAYQSEQMDVYMELFDADPTKAAEIAQDLRARTAKGELDASLADRIRGQMQLRGFEYHAAQQDKLLEDGANPYTLAAEYDRLREQEVISIGQQKQLTSELTGTIIKAQKAQMGADYQNHVLDCLKLGAPVEDFVWTDAGGTEHTLNAKKHTAAAMDTLWDTAQSGAARAVQGGTATLLPGETPDAAVARIAVNAFAPILVKNAIKYDRFDTLLQSAARSVGTRSSTSSEGNPQFKNGLMLWRALYSADPKAAVMQTDAKTAQFWQMASRAYDNNKGDVAATENDVTAPTSITAESSDLLSAAFRQAEVAALSEEFTSFWKWDSPPLNLNQMREVYLVQMKDAIKNNATVEDAKDMAMDYINNRFVTIDGVMYPRLERMPNGVSEEALSAIKLAYHKAHGSKEDIDVDELIVMPDGNNPDLFRLYHTKNGSPMPVANWQDNVGTFTMSAVRTLSERIAGAGREDIATLTRRELEAKVRDRLRAWERGEWMSWFAKTVANPNLALVSGTEGMNPPTSKDARKAHGAMFKEWEAAAREQVAKERK